MGASYKTRLSMKKPSGDFEVMKCDAILFGECINPQILPQQNYSIAGEWIIINISSFSGYGPVDMQPDLTPISLVYTPQHPDVNQEVKIFSVIENKGLGNATGVNVSLFVDGIYQEHRIVDLLYGSQKTMNFTWNAQGGIHNITLNNSETIAMAVKKDLAFLKTSGVGLEETHGLIGKISENLWVNEMNIYGILTITSSILLFVDWSEREKALQLIRNSLREPLTMKKTITKKE